MTLLTGTNGHTWRDFANRLCDVNRESILAMDASADHLGKHLQSGPQANAIIFAESPASLIADESSDARATLDKWKASASALLTLWRKNRQRAVILNWDECLADPAAFEEWLTGRFSRKSGKAACLPAPSDTSIAQRVLAGVIVARDRDVKRLWNELLAASQPIAKELTSPDVLSPELALKELAANEAKLLEDHNALVTRHSSLVTALEELQDQHSSLAAERDDLLAKLEESKQRSAEASELLLQEIQNAHKEAEDFFEQLETARADCEATKQELAATRAAQASDKQELERAQGELAALQSESQSIKENAVRNHEMLLQEIQNAQKESEDFFEQWKRLEASAGEIHLLVERVLRGGEKHHTPHNHLDYVFESASLFDRHWRRLPVRLVEHNGNAGIAIFHHFGNGITPLYHWEPSGQETGLDFMLFVPSDKKSVAKLVGLPASDLLLVRDAAAMILGDLSVHEGPEARHWLPVARRLLQEIEEIPERLHYDSVAGFVHQGNDERSIRFNATNLYFRGNCARSYVVDWTPAAFAGIFRLETSKADTPLLRSSTSEVIVRFASSEEKESIRTLWPRLTAHDRTFLLLLAKALPDFVFHVCEQHPDQKLNKERLTNQARKLYRRLRNLDRKLKLRNAIAKAIRR